MERNMQTNQEAIMARILDNDFKQLVDFNVQPNYGVEVNFNSFEEEDIDNFNSYSCLLVAGKN
jgi:hypothetical protein